MKAVSVRRIPDEVHHALRLRAAARGCSVEAVIRDILAEAVIMPDEVYAEKHREAVEKIMAAEQTLADAKLFLSNLEQGL